ncbi:solute carrier family 35 member F2 [Aulostomus maculatus]
MKTLKRLFLNLLRPQVQHAEDPLQFAYRWKVGVEDAVLYMLHRAHSHLDKGKGTVRILFLDFSSAFNTIQPPALQDKLLQMRVDPGLIAWISSDLTDRPQFVRLKDITSDTVVSSIVLSRGLDCPLPSSPYFTSSHEGNIQMKVLLTYNGEDAAMFLQPITLQNLTRCAPLLLRMTSMSCKDQRIQDQGSGDQRIQDQGSGDQRIQDQGSGDQSHELMRRSKKLKDREVFTLRLARTLGAGQGLAALVCGTAVSSQFLASNFRVNAPMLQSLLNYALLCATYTAALLCRPGDGNILQILKSRWWKYLLLGLVDVEANYTVVKAYQYTTLTSVQLLDCFVIPVLMILSWWVLKTRYRPVHYVAVCTCLLGVGAMVGADLLAGRDQGSTSNILLGDGLVLLSSTLYAVSNVCQEYTVKNLSRVEFLGMVGLFGTIISTIQMLILEQQEVASIQWSWQIGLLFSGYAFCMYGVYSLMPVAMKLSSATSINLSLLTADLFSLFCGIFLFQYKFSGLYLVSLVVILIGFITFNTVPTSRGPASSSICEEGCYDNPAATQEVAVKIPHEVEREFI